jgi:Ca2+:H+ antiporter
MAGTRTDAYLPWWSWVLPVLGWAALLLLFGATGTGAAVLAAALVGTVFAAVHHAEVVAHRLGEPFGTLVLALAVTVIEAGLILSVMLGHSEGKPTLVRDTMLAVIMIVLNGLVGLCLVLGGARHHEQGFQARGATAFLAVLVAQATLVLVLPTYTTSSPGPVYTPVQLGFVAVVSFVLWFVLVFVQTVRHRDYFLPDPGADSEGDHAPPPPARAAWISFAVMLAALTAVVLMGKALTPALEAALDAAGAPAAVVGVAIAAIVLLPEGLAAVRAARRNRLQTSLNLALGSILASIGLTTAAVAVAALALGQTLTLGLDAVNTVLLALSFAVAILTLAGGRTTVLQGAVHLVIFASWLFFVLVP